MTTIHARSGTWYDPDMVSMVLTLSANGLLNELASGDLASMARDLEPNWLTRLVDADQAERLRRALLADEASPA
jgi:hypothetical protein